MLPKLRTSLTNILKINQPVENEVAKADSIAESPTQTEQVSDGEIPKTENLTDKLC